MGKESLDNARKKKDDEFYTRYCDIEKEIPKYNFKGSVVYCNCDDPRKSNFVRYFIINFHKLGLKRLIASCYINQDVDLFSLDKEHNPALFLDYDGGEIDIENIPVRPLCGDGDFRSSECMSFLSEADVVVTNPPYSLVREFVSLMIRKKKRFLIVSFFLSFGYLELLPYVARGEICAGGNLNKFERQNGEQESITSYWMTNLRNAMDNPFLELKKSIKDLTNTKIDGSNIVNIDKICNIPNDYDGVMGVPINYLTLHNPSQFDIVGIRKNLRINGNLLFTRILIIKK